MRSFSSLLVFILSFISFVAPSPLHSTTHSSRLTKNPISRRQFHYPRAAIDVCADVDLSLILKDVLGLELDSLLGDICLCLSAFPLDLDLYANLKLLVSLLGKTKLEAILKTLVEDNGTQCTYPDHASPECTAGNVCAFTCTDGFIKEGSGCVCPLPNSVRNGRCGSSTNLYTSALPRAPTRRSTSSRKSSPGSHSGGLLNVDANVNLNLGGSSGLDLGGLLSGLLGSPGTASGGNQSSGSGNDIDIGALVNGLLDSLRISVPIPGGNHSSGLEVDLYVCIGAGVPGTQSLLGTITDLVNSLLSSLLGATLNCNVDSSCSASVAPDTISIDLQVCGLVGDSLGSTLDKTLEKVTSLLNNLLDGVKIVINSSVGGPGCSATPTLSGSSQLLPSPSTPVVIPHPSVSPSSSWTPNGTNLSWLTSILGRVEGILGGLGLSLGDYGLDPGAGLVVGVSVGLGYTLNGADGLVPAVVALVGETLNCLLATNDTIQVDSNPIPSSTTSNLGPGDGIVVDIDLGIVVNATLSNAGAVVDVVLSGVSGVLADLLNLDVLVNVNGGHDCGCNRSGGASAKKRVGASSYL